MKCEEYQDQLLPYMDRQLSPAEEADLIEHLKGCAVCAEEMKEIKQFSRQIHNATIPFRQASERIRSHALSVERAPAPSRFRKFLVPAWIGAAIVLIVIVGYFAFPSRTSDIERLASWGIGRYPLLDQAHAVSGNAETVRAWFQEHHHIDVAPPQRVNYSELTGCKMTQFGSEQVPILRFNGKQTRAVFILPSESYGFLGGNREVRVLSRKGFRIELWAEGKTPYMALTKEL